MAGTRLGSRRSGQSQYVRGTILPPFDIETVDGKQIAFIGLTLEGTPSIVTPSAVAGLDDLDAFTAYLTAHQPVAPPPLDRIHKDA